jgi:hypothetical protein
VVIGGYIVQSRNLHWFAVVIVMLGMLPVVLVATVILLWR